MPLSVFTARISYSGADKFDCTRKSGTEGLFLAPSWLILGPALRLMRAGHTGYAWATYVPEYLDEMRRSYVDNRPQWTALLARSRVVLCCYCTDPEHCHRALLRARILPALGATDCGELAA
mgnify:CR=1 FL=1